jgi:hypothetical protein
LLQEQLLSGWSHTMHTNSLAMAGDYRDLGFLGKGPMVDGLAVSAGKRQTEVVATQPPSGSQKGGISSIQKRGHF